VQTKVERLENATSMPQCMACSQAREITVLIESIKPFSCDAGIMQFEELEFMTKREKFCHPILMMSTSGCAN
jgi:hypothetical protein